MCGVIGVSLREVGLPDLSLIREVFKQTMIRGKHATGLTYLKGGELHTIKSGVPVDVFFENFDLSECINEDGGIYLIGHIRYSTSDLRYNQPFDNGNISIVHNGVISQEEPSTWKYKTETANDSELILHSLASGVHPLADFHPASMAVCTLSVDKEITAFRNESRPLYLSKLKKGVIFTSTRDIAKRSGLKVETEKLDMYSVYRYNNELFQDNKFVGIYDVEDMQ